MDTHGPVGRLTRKQTTSRPDTLWAEIWKICQKKRKWAIEKPKLDKARRLRGIYFIDPEDKEFKEIKKNARRKLGIPMPAAMPCKLQRCQYRETCCSVGEHKTKYACIVEADESMTKRMLIESLQFGAQTYFFASSNENTRRKGSSGEIMRKLEKISAWQLMKVRNRNELIAEARNEGRKVHFASLMDLCHLKNSELEPQFQKYSGRIVLRGDIVKGDSGSYAVFTEQGSSASQMTAAKIMDIISRLTGCDGQAADAVSAYTQVIMEHAPLLSKIPKSECPDIWIRLPRHKWPKSWSSMEDPVVHLERKAYGHPLAGLLWERQFEKVLLEHGREKVPNWDCLLVNRASGKYF